MSGIVFDLDEYSDIDLEDFDKWLVDKCFKVPSEWGLYKDKYDVVFTFYKDPVDNRLTITAEIGDYSNVPVNPALHDALMDIHMKKHLKAGGKAQHIVKKI